MIRVDTSKAAENLSVFSSQLSEAHRWLQKATGRGNDFVGWVNLPRDYDKEEFARIQAAAKKIQTAKPWWSSASAAAIWGPRGLSISSVPPTTT